MVYKLLLCWRYLKTRYLALVCIVSVMLGVATLIVVNSVMTGFSTKLRERLHGHLSDMEISSGGDFLTFADPEGKMALIRADPFLNERIDQMTATLETFAMLQFKWAGRPETKLVHVIGLKPESRAKLPGFAEFLEVNKERPASAFTLEDAAVHLYFQNHPNFFAMPLPSIGPGGKSLPDPPPSKKPEIPARIILGHAIAHYPNPEKKGDEVTILYPGDDAILTVIAGEGEVMRPVNYRYVVSDYYKTEMSEYDSQYAFVPLQHLQDLRSMPGRVSNIQVKLKNYDRDAKLVKERFAELFAGSGLYVQTWEDKQGPLLAAISIERGILNVILFMIVGVAGFGILAIFSMIVSEKTRDIGVLKALGASNRGVMGIFLGYGLLLGVVGAVLGTGIGASVTIYINEIEKALTYLTGHELFDRKIYYFRDIPTDMQLMSLVLINAGAIAIAVAFSVIPALRAAWLRPVQALRYE